MVVASALACIIFPPIHIEMISFQIFHSYAWFVGYYFFVVLVGALFFNSFLCSLEQKRYLALLLSLLALISFGWTGAVLEGLAGGLRTAFSGLFFYALGGYIRRYEPFGRFRAGFFIVAVFLCIAVIVLSASNLAFAKIESGVVSGTMSHSLITFDNYNILIIIMAVCLFELFKRISIPNNRVVNFLGSATFMTYLIHENDFFHSFWWQYDWLAVLNRSPMMFMAKCVTWTLISFACGVVAYALYLLMMRACKGITKLFLKPETAEINYI